MMLCCVYLHVKKCAVHAELIHQFYPSNYASAVQGIMGEPEREHTDVKRRKACMWMRGTVAYYHTRPIVCT